MLSVKNISANVGSFALNNISFDVKKGEFHVVVGQTGSGKTLLLESLVGLLKHKQGSIWLNGNNITTLPPEKRGIAYVPQDLAIFPHLTVRENIFYGSKVRNLRLTELNKKAFDLIEMTGISHLLDRKPKHLSGGEKQRIALVRAIAAGCEILVMDEPLSSLNQSLKFDLQYLLKELHIDFGLTIIMVTHDLDEAFLLADRISVMSNGSILQTSEKEELFHYPNSIEVAQFLGINNLFDAKLISSSNSQMQVFCNELNARLMVSHVITGIKPDEKITLGIRNEEIMILRADLEKKMQSNVFKAIIESINQKGPVYQIKLITTESGRFLFIDVPGYAFKKLGLKLKQEVNITLREESIFCVKA